MAIILPTYLTINTEKSPIISENTSQNIEQIYDKYAPIIYGIISSLTDNVVISEKIFTDTFIKIKDNFPDFKVNGTSYPTLMRFTYSFTIQQLIQYGISPKVSNFQEANKLTHLLCTRYESLQDVTSLLNISDDEARKNIRKEHLVMNQ